MAYKIKRNPKLNEASFRAKRLKFNYWELDNKANEVYGSDFSKLSIKEQDKISRKVAKGFYYEVK